jgi:hypothetical protein
MLVSNDGRACDGDWVKPDYVIRDLLEAVRLVAALETVARDCGGDGLPG